jgi:hypothetical protein
MTLTKKLKSSIVTWKLTIMSTQQNVLTIATNKAMTLDSAANKAATTIDQIATNKSSNTSNKQHQTKSSFSNLRGTVHVQLRWVKSSANR